MVHIFPTDVLQQPSEIIMPTKKNPLRDVNRKHVPTISHENKKIIDEKVH